MSGEGERIEQNAMRLRELEDVWEKARKKTKANTRAMYASMIEEGKALFEIHALLPHGAWLPWLEEHGEQEDTAERRIALYKTGYTPNQIHELGGMAKAIRKFRTVRNLEVEPEHQETEDDVLIEPAKPRKDLELAALRVRFAEAQQYIDALESQVRELEAKASPDTSALQKALSDIDDYIEQATEEELLVIIEGMTYAQGVIMDLITRMNGNEATEDAF